MSTLRLYKCWSTMQRSRQQRTQRPQLFCAVHRFGSVSAPEKLGRKWRERERDDYSVTTAAEWIVISQGLKKYSYHVFQAIRPAPLGRSPVKISNGPLIVLRIRLPGSWNFCTHGVVCMMVLLTSMHLGCISTIVFIAHDASTATEADRQHEAATINHYGPAGFS